MIVVAKSPKEWQALAGFLQHYAKVAPSSDLQCIGWVSEQKLVMVVGLDGFLGGVAQIHVAYLPGWHYTPKAMLREVFRYAFVTAKREMLLGILNSKNEEAMNFDLRLGFREVLRLPGMHEEGGDFVVLAMRKSECRYLKTSAEVTPIRRAAAGSA